MLPLDDVSEWGDDAAPLLDSDPWVEESGDEAGQVQRRVRLRADLLPGLEVCRDALAGNAQVRATPLCRRLLAEVDAALAAVRGEGWDPTDLDNEMTRAVAAAGKLRRLAVARLVSAAAAVEWLSVAGVTHRLRVLAAYARRACGVTAAGPAEGLYPGAAGVCAPTRTVAEGGAFAALAPPVSALSG